jgi:hypothetical protein
MSPGESGVRIDFVYPGGSADGYLEEGDVLLELDGHAIANDGSVSLDGNRLPFGVLADRHQIGGSVALTILRRGARHRLEVPMNPYPGMSTLSNAYDRLPRYYVYGGLVFVPLERQLLMTFGEDMSLRSELLHELFYRRMLEPRLPKQEAVVLLRRLDHPVNAAMAWHRDLVVEQVNGRPIDRLEDLIEAIESHEGTYHLFEFGYRERFGVLHREDAEAANEEILALYGVPQDRRL